MMNASTVAASEGMGPESTAVPDVAPPDEYPTPPPPDDAQAHGAGTHVNPDPQSEFA
jgi:hypothetical protein